MNLSLMYGKILLSLGTACVCTMGMVWINKLQFFRGVLFKWDRCHIVDYNLFYMNIRENMAERVDAYLKKQPD